MSSLRESTHSGLSTVDAASARARQTETRSTMTVTDAEPIERRPADRAQSGQSRSVHAPLFAGSDAQEWRTRWSDIQAGFVDEPRHAVQQADGLVAEVIQQLAEVFASERRSLEQRWDRDGGMDTEQLRQALRRYRSFFDRLLAM